MAKRNYSPRESPSTDAGNPQQFRLMDLFALMTLVALVSAMVAPLLRGLESDYRNLLLRIIGSQLLLAAGTIVYYAKKRKKLLDKSGAKIGIAFCGQFRWRYWPVARVLFSMVFGVLIQTLFAAVMTYNLLNYGVLNGPISVMIDRLPVSHWVLHYVHFFSFLDYFFYVQYSFFVGIAFSLYRWRAYPNSMEFFEHGIVKNGTTFIPWEHIKVRPSSFFVDKIAVVFRMSPDSIGSTIIMAQVSDELSEKVFAAANAAHSTNQDEGA